MQPTDPRIKAILDHSDDSLANLKLGDHLGSGSFGSVYKIDEKLAVKQINIKKLMDCSDDEEELYENLSCAFSEFQTMSKNLPNIVSSYRCHFDKGKKIFSFTMDLMEKDLETLISDKKGIPFEQFYNLFEDIVSGKYGNLFRDLSKKFKSLK